MYENLYIIAKSNDLDYVKADFARFKGQGEKRIFTHSNIVENEIYCAILFGLGVLVKIGKVHHIVGEYGELFFSIVGTCPRPVDRGEGHYFVVGGD